MSRLGVWQCKRLSVNFCKWAGSSRGVRDFLDRYYPDFKADNPQLLLEEIERHGRHPYLEAKYKNGNVRVVDVKNKEAEEILRLAHLLRSAAGKNTSKPLERQVLPKLRIGGKPDQASPSVQGRWTVSLFSSAQEIQ